MRTEWLREQSETCLQLMLVGKLGAPMTKEGVGRATWTFYHSCCSDVNIITNVPLQGMFGSFLEDSKEHSLVFIEARHFLWSLNFKSNPVQAGYRAEFSQWLCHFHNTINRSVPQISGVGLDDKVQ
ncbi:hypothetical protein ACLB2K_012709 [Fragaria x ananassa]